MKAIFLSDAHLKRENDHNYQVLLTFLKKLDNTLSPQSDAECNKVPQENGCKGRLQIDHLFILGDFFDFWFCHGNRIYPEYRAIVEQLNALKDQGIMIHFAEGNHDFFLADYFTRILGFEVITHWGEWHDGDRKILFAHGDTIDLDNRKYLLLRKILRTRFVYRLQQILPLRILWGIARITSGASKEWSPPWAGVSPEMMHAIAKQRLDEGFDAVVLGHCHNPLLREWNTTQGKKTTVTLGDWVRDFSYLYYADGMFFLRTETT